MLDILTCDQARKTYNKTTGVKCHHNNVPASKIGLIRQRLHMMDSIDENSRPRKTKFSKDGENIEQESWQWPQNRKDSQGD